MNDHDEDEDLGLVCCDVCGGMYLPEDMAMADLCRECEQVIGEEEDE